MNVGIIGGTDGLGKTIITYLHDEFNVAISGRDHQKGRKVANSYDVEYYESNTELAANSDILIISVPMNFTTKVIREVADHMKAGSLLIDVTSVKEIPTKVMSEVLPEDVEFIPTHPIFGPRTVNLDNQIVVLTPLKKGQWYEKVYKYLEDKNIRIIETTPEEHDHMMSVVQVLTHFSFISTASAMEKLKVNISKTEDYESPIYNLMIDIIARIVSQTPYLTYYIQTMNKNGENIRNAFADAVVELQEAINNGDEETFIEIANKSTENMGDIQAALGRSDKAIDSLTQEFTILKEHLGEEVGLKHIYTGKVHIGVLEKLTKHTLTLNNNKTLKLSNIKILTEEELYKWKLENYKHITRTISYEFNKRVNLEIILETINNIKNIISIAVIDIHTDSEMKDDHISITFKISALYEEAIEKSEEILTGFGGIIR